MSSRSCPTRRCPSRRAGCAGCRSGCSTSRSCGSSAADGIGVVGEVRRDRVAVLVVRHPLVQRLRRALGDAAVLLAGDQQRVEDAPAVVDGDVAQHRDLAGLGVDLDDRHVRAERERRVGAVEVELVAQRRRARARRAASTRPSTPTASSAHVTATWPARRRRAAPPSPTTMSSAAASSRWAAICLARSSTSFGGDVDRRCRRSAATASPSCPTPRGTRSVSELTSVILSIGMPSTSLASIANAVWWPWPCTLVPANTRGGAVVVDLAPRRTRRAARPVR